MMRELSRRYYPPGRAGEFGLKMDIEREQKKRLDKKMCLESHGPGYTWNKVIGRCIAAVSPVEPTGGGGENVADLLTPSIQPGDFPQPAEVSTSPPEGGSTGAGAAVQAEMNKRKAKLMQKMQQPAKPPIEQQGRA